MRSLGLCRHASPFLRCRHDDPGARRCFRRPGARSCHHGPGQQQLHLRPTPAEPPTTAPVDTTVAPSERPATYTSSRVIRSGRSPIPTAQQWWNCARSMILKKGALLHPGQVLKLPPGGRPRNKRNKNYRRKSRHGRCKLWQSDPKDRPRHEKTDFILPRFSHRRPLSLHRFSPLGRSGRDSAVGGSGPARASYAGREHCHSRCRESTPALTPFPYTVAHGDSLASIAEKFGLTVKELKRLNNLPTTRVAIKPGEVLEVVNGPHAASAKKSALAAKKKKAKSTTQVAASTGSTGPSVPPEYTAGATGADFDLSAGSHPSAPATAKPEEHGDSSSTSAATAITPSSAPVAKLVSP